MCSVSILEQDALLNKLAAVVVITTERGEMVLISVADDNNTHKNI
jgi:hypothetical protein